MALDDCVLADFAIVSKLNGTFVNRDLPTRTSFVQERITIPLSVEHRVTGTDRAGSGGTVPNRDGAIGKIGAIGALIPQEGLPRFEFSSE